MGFRWDTPPLETLYDERPLLRVARRIVDRVGDYLKDRVEFYTPVGQPPPGFDVKGGSIESMETWLRERGRRPGTLKGSWEKGELLVILGGVVTVTVQTFDPIAPYVEYPTRPHTIRPRRPGGILRFRDSRTGQVVFAAEVHHPGTEGSYMMTRALQDTAVQWRVIAEEELAQWAAG